MHDEKDGYKISAYRKCSEQKVAYDLAECTRAILSEKAKGYKQRKCRKNYRYRAVKSLKLGVCALLAFIFVLHLLMYPLLAVDKYIYHFTKKIGELQ